MADYLVIQAARFGDLVQSKRLIDSVARHGQVHLALDGGLADLAKILYPQAILHCLNFHQRPDPEALEHNKKIFSALGEIDFKKIYNCNFSPLTGALCRLFAEDRIVGYRGAHDFDGGLCRSAWCRLAFRLTTMRPATALNLVDFWAYFESRPIAPDIVNPPARGGGKGIGLVMAGREPRRSLPVDLMQSILSLAWKLLDKPPVRLLGSVNEEPAAKKLLKYLDRGISAKTENLCGKTNWRQLCDSLEGMDLLITPDTGIMHLAARLGVPVMAFFLSSAWCHETGPYGQGHIVWQTALPCSPCNEHQTCPHNVACLELLKDPSFGRFMALALQNRMASLSLPASLQCWSTDTDEFGAVCNLVGGVDKEAARRRNIRALLASQALKIPPLPNPGQMAENLYGNLVAALFPDEEWMLPPGRYF